MRPCPNRTTVGLKAGSTPSTSATAASPNRTTVGLKAASLRAAIVLVLWSQSHHSGIERYGMPSQIEVWWRVPIAPQWD